MPRWAHCAEPACAVCVSPMPHSPGVCSASSATAMSVNCSSPVVRPPALVLEVVRRICPQLLACQWRADWAEGGQQSHEGIRFTARPHVGFVLVLIPLVLRACQTHNICEANAGGVAKDLPDEAIPSLEPGGGF